MYAKLSYTIDHGRVTFTLNCKGIILTSEDFYQVTAIGMILRDKHPSDFAEYAMRVAAQAYGYTDTEWLRPWIRQEYEKLTQSIRFMNLFTDLSDL